MGVLLKIEAANKPGVLDRITGLIRRNGWNIDSLTAEYLQEGISLICIVLSGKGVDAGALGERLSEMDSVRAWEQTAPSDCLSREMLPVTGKQEAAQ